MITITVIGEGAWGTAVATLLAHNGHKVFLWCHDEKVKHALEATRTNDRYLPGIQLPETIIPVTDLNVALSQSSWVFEATPIKYLRSVLETINPHVCKKKPWVILSKGIENNTLMLPGQIINSVLGSEVPQVVFFGPSFAHDLANRHITAVTLASHDEKLALSLQAVLASDYFKSKISSDPVGVQLCGALKNVIALSIGMLSGAGYGENTKAFVLTQGLQEMVDCVVACGGHKETVYGLAGVGDLILTSMSHHSRNVKVGVLLGQGKKLDTILQETGMIPEGINTLISIHELIQQKNLKMPLFEGIYCVVFGNTSIQSLLQQL